LNAPKQTNGKRWIAGGVALAACLYMVVDTCRLLTITNQAAARASSPRTATHETVPAKAAAAHAPAAVMRPALPTEPVVLRGDQIDESDRSDKVVGDPLVSDGKQKAAVRTLVKVGHIRAGVPHWMKLKDEKVVADIMERAAREIYALDRVEGIDTSVDSDADLEPMLLKYNKIMAHYQLELQKHMTGRFEFGRAGQWMIEMDTRHDWSRLRS
jgi:hypothetical protein